MSGLFLSRARLRPGSNVAAIASLLLPPERSARLLASHRLVWSVMSDTPDRARDFLWREERQGAFLILAPRAAAGDLGLFDVESKPWEPALRTGDRLGFLLRANPTISRSKGPGRRGTRHDVVMDALHQVPRGERAGLRREAVVAAGQAWLMAQGARAGFVPEADGLRIDGYDRIRVPRESGDPACFGRLEFEGTLAVTDPRRFVAAVAAGFGRARAFGCGLMLLRRA